MIKALLKSAARRFGRRYDYDVSYMAHIIDTSTSAGLRLSLLPLISQYRGPKAAQDVWVGAILGSTMEGDCGPCAQLVLDMAIEAGAPADLLTLCVEGQPERAGDVGLGFRFTQAAITGSFELDALRAEIESRFGATAVTAASFAAATGRVYPVLKRGLGYGHACSRLTVARETVELRQAG